jgi:glycosyltransferase involved in cell wall biosynthesis
MKVALVYDRLNKWGGAERVLLALHKIFPDAPLYTSVYNSSTAAWAKVFDVRTSSLQNLKVVRAHNEMLGLFMPVSFESFNFDEYDLVISVTSESANGILTKPGTFHVCYCLTPTRYLWSGYDEYFRGKAMRTISSPALRYLRRWDKLSANRPDEYIAISTEVKNRIKKFYDRESQVIFPPIMIEKRKAKETATKDFYLLVSRLSRLSYYKKVDLAIEAFNQTGLDLKIVGGGPMEKKLKRKASKNIEFLGELTDSELAYYYESCKALVFPGLEDFGLVMAEAQFFGKPVIAYAGGGALDIVKEGKTGRLFKEQSVKSLVEALKSFDGRSYNKREIAQNGERFTFDKFRIDLENFIAKRM